MLSTDLTSLGKREAQRIGVRGDIGLIAGGDSVRHLGRLRDLSISGARVLLEENLPVGSMVQVAFRCSGNGPPLRVTARVAWTRNETRGETQWTSAGLAFEEVGEEDMEHLRTYIDQQMWALLDSLGQLPQMSEFNDLEKMVLASICFRLDIGDGVEVPSQDLSGCLVMVRKGKLRVVEQMPGDIAIAREIEEEDSCGGLPLDHRGRATLQATAVGPTSLVALGGDGLDYFIQRNPVVAMKLLGLYCLSLEDRIRALHCCLPTPA